MRVIKALRAAFFAALAFLTVGQPAPAALAIVQHKSANPGQGTPSGGTLTSTPTVGNVVVAVICTNWGQTAGTLGSRWAIFAQGKDSTGGSGGEGVYATAMYEYVQSGDTTTLPAFYTAGNTYYTWSVYEISGVTGTFSKDFQQSAGQHIIGATTSSPRQITQNGSTLAFSGSCAYNGSTAITYSAGWTIDEAGANSGVYGSYAAAHQAFSSSGSAVQATIGVNSLPAGDVQFVLQSSVASGAPYVRNFGGDTGAVGGSLDVQITFPQTPIVGDLMVSCVHWSNGSKAQPTIAAGWTALQSALNGSDPIIWCAYRYAQAGDTASLLLTSTTTNWATDTWELAGVAGTIGTDFDKGEGTYQASGNSQTTTSQSTAHANALALIACGKYNDGNAPVFSAFNVNNAEATTAAWGGYAGGNNYYGAAGSSVSDTCTYGTGAEPSGYVQMLFDYPPAGSAHGAMFHSFP